MAFSPTFINSSNFGQGQLGSQMVRPQFQQPQQSQPNQMQSQLMHPINSMPLQNSQSTAPGQMQSQLMHPISSMPLQPTSQAAANTPATPGAPNASSVSPQQPPPPNSAGRMLGSQGTAVQSFQPTSSNPMQNMMMGMNKMQGAGNTNFMMNQPGAQGQQAQAGFQGFQQNGSGYQNLGAGPTYSQGPQNGGQQFQNNGAWSGQNGQVGNASTQGAYGQQSGPQTSQQQSLGQQQVANSNYGYMSNDPSYQQPGQWLQGANAGYGVAGSNPTLQSSQAGAYYSNQGNPNASGAAPTAGSPNGSSFQGPGGGMAYGGQPGQSWTPPPASGNGLTPYTGQQSQQMSDERQKTNIEPGTEHLQDFLNALGAYSYEYKDKQFGDKTYVSPMAQELEKTAIGKSAVIETQHGKMVNYGRIAGAQLAATAMINHKVNALEKKITSLLKEKINAKRSK